MRPDFAPAHRLLGIYAWNKQHDAGLASQYLQRAVALAPDNARFLFELDYLNKQLGKGIDTRLSLLMTHREVSLKRDDLTAELLSLWHGVGEYALAAEVLCQREFHPWEGGEGKITGQYLLNQLHRALEAMRQGEETLAVALLQEALRYPHNLGEGRLPGQSDNDIWYLLAYCHQRLGEGELSGQALARAMQGESGLGAGRYYNDQPADYLFWQGMAMRMSDECRQADAHFQRFLGWVAQNRDRVPETDFFAVSLPDLVALDASPALRHQQHCLFIEALGQLGLGNRDACQRTLTRLLILNPAYDKALLIVHALASGLFD